jgi:hypothetical protein
MPHTPPSVATQFEVMWWWRMKRLRWNCGSRRRCLWRWHDDLLLASHNGNAGTPGRTESAWARAIRDDQINQENKAQVRVKGTDTQRDDGWSRIKDYSSIGHHKHQKRAPKGPMKLTAREIDKVPDRNIQSLILACDIAGRVSSSTTFSEWDSIESDRSNWTNLQSTTRAC